MLGRRDVIENCRVRASENSLLHKSHKKTGTVVRIDFFRTLETSQRLAAIWEVYVQEKWLNLNKNSKFYGVLSCLIPIFFFSCTVALKINSLGTSLVVQWLRLPMQGVWVRSLVGELGSHMPRGQKNQNIKQKQCCNTFNKDFKNGPHQKSLKILKQKNKQKNPKMHIGVNYGSLWLVRFVLCSHILKC